MSQKKSGRRTVGAEQDGRRMVVNLQGVHALLAMVVFIAFTIFGIAVQNWVVVAVFALLSIAAAITSRAILRRG